MSSEPDDLAEEQPAPEDQPEVPAGRSRLGISLLALVALLVLALATAWLSRERIADNLIASELEKRGIPASYRIESISAREQVLADLVVGDPERPDFTAQRIIVSIRPRFGFPEIGLVRLVKPRIYGSYLKGKLSFGALDPLIFTDSKEPFRLPDMDLSVEDGRGLIESDLGAVGLRLDGRGNLRGGFAGQVAALSNDAAIGGCAGNKVTLFGKVSVSRERPHFKGPLRLAGLACPEIGLRLADAVIRADITGDPGMDGAEGSLDLNSGAARVADYAMRAGSGTGRFSWRNDRLTVRYDLAAKAIDTPQLRVPDVKFAGRLRGFDGLSRIDLESDVSGSVEALGQPVQGAIADLARAGDGNLLGALAGKAGSALRREARGATFKVSLVARHTPGGDSLVVPGAILRGRSGQPLVSLSRLQVRAGQGGPQVLAGSFQTGGPDLPRISGTVRRIESGGFAANLAMAEYAIDDSRLAVPGMDVVQRGERLDFTGEMRLSGAIPGGRADNLVLPVSGDWRNGSEIAVWRSCIPVSFDRLKLSDLEISKRTISLCPPSAGAIVRSGPSGLKVAAGVPSLDLAGALGQTPIRVVSGPLGFAWPGNLAARHVDVTLGPRRSASTFRLSELSARLGSDIAGGFGGAEVKLDAVPLDLSDVSGRWRYANGVLSLSQASLRVSDREQVDRFEPLIANGASLRLADNQIVAAALLREPTSDREVLRADIRHDLTSGRGNADLLVDNLVFDQRLQPDTLTHLALGVIANARGAVRGTGRIDWNEVDVTSTGRFSTDSLDFAAAFGPVTGASGAIEFTDLLGLVTAPDQTLKVASINPGIEVNDGRVTYELLPGNVLRVKSARWPFMDGKLRLRPVDIELGTDHSVRYVLVINGIDAARFVQHLELANLAATGTFDGRLPLIFDKDGGRIERGRLTSREPGGNLSYVGELTYKDLSPMGNYAFDALRSIDFRQMGIQLDGPLDGEIITRVAFEGISQGQGATSNFVTKRIAKLPIRFRLNIRAPFIQLVTSMRSLYDPEYILDPRVLGITGNAGAPATRPKPNVQPSESDKTP